MDAAVEQDGSHLREEFPCVFGPIARIPGAAHTIVQFLGVDLPMPAKVMSFERVSIRLSDNGDSAAHFFGGDVCNILRALQKLGYKEIGVCRNGHMFFLKWLQYLKFMGSARKHKHFKDEKKTIYNKECPVCCSKFVWNAKVILKPCGHASHEGCCKCF